MQLSPGFFEKRYPDFSVAARGESGIAILGHWQVIINDHRGLLAVQKEADQVDASLVNLLSHEHLFDAFGELSERAKRSQIVAVAKLTLVDIVRFYTVLEYINWLVDLAGAFPLKRVIRLLVHFVYVRIV